MNLYNFLGLQQIFTCIRCGCIPLISIFRHSYLKQKYVVTSKNRRIMICKTVCTLSSSTAIFGTIISNPIFLTFFGKKFFLRGNFNFQKSSICRKKFTPFWQKKFLTPWGPLPITPCFSVTILKNFDISDSKYQKFDRVTHFLTKNFLKI